MIVIVLKTFIVCIYSLSEESSAYISAKTKYAISKKLCVMTFHHMWLNTDNTKSLLINEDADSFIECDNSDEINTSVIWISPLRFGQYMDCQL